MNTLTDDLDDLVALFEETLAEVKAETATPADLDDLDALLAESTKLSSAIRDRNQGRKLSQSQLETLAANEAAAGMRTWEEQAEIAHFVTSACECGTVTTRLSAWYKVIYHRTQQASKLIRCDPSGELPQFKYITHERVGHCICCQDIAALPITTVSAFPLLAELGKVCLHSN